MLAFGERLIVFDLETGGLDPARHPVIQFAGIALDHEWREIDSLEIKVRFNLAVADQAALDGNSYDAALWAAEAVPPGDALASVDSFLRRHATLRKRGSKPPHNPYTVARLCGHNAVRFDAEFLASWFKRGGLFCPAACYEALDTLQLARWYVLRYAPEGRPENLKLETLCAWCGIPLADAHDALADVRATAELAHRLASGIGIIPREEPPA